MKQTWVIDSNVLYCAARTGRRGASPGDLEESSDALVLVKMITQQHWVAEDASGRIAVEYKRMWQKIRADLQAHPTFLAVHQMWDLAFSRAHFRGERPLPTALLKKAKQENMKSDGDIAFIEAANATSSKLLASMDSDFSNEFRKDLLEAPDVGVRVMGTKDALGHAWPPRLSSPD